MTLAAVRRQTAHGNDCCRCCFVGDATAAAALLLPPHSVLAVIYLQMMV